MADRIAKTAVEAIYWYKFGAHGGIMPVRERTSANKQNGIIVGARKATLWDGIKVAFYSKTEKAALQRARGEALIALIHAEKPAFRNGNNKATFIDSKGREHEVKHQDPVNISLSGNTEGDSTLLLGEVLHKLLKKGALPAVAEVGEPTKKSPDVRKPGQTSRVEWEYNPATDTPIRRELNPILVRRTGVSASDWTSAESKTQANLGAKGWVPLREKITFVDKGMPDAANIFVQTGKFSTIAMRPEERMPADFPETFTEYFESYDEKGILRVENAATAAGVYEPKQPRQWTLFERDARDLKNGTAKYSSPTGKENPEFDVKVVRLEETVRHPQNLILEHTNGSVAGGFTVWQVVKDARIRSADGKIAARWVKTTYDAKGEEVMPYKLNKDGTYSYETRDLKHGSVLCGDPFVYLSAQDKNRYPKETKVRFADKLGGVAFEVSNPTKDIQNAAGPRDEINVRERTDARLLTGKITQPNADKPTGYDKQYNTILTRGKDLYREKIAHLTQALQEGTGDPLLGPVQLKELQADLAKIERVIKDKKTLHKREVESKYLKPKGLQLTLDSDVMKRLEAQLKAAGRLEYRVGPDGNKHILSANIFNHGNDWRKHVLKGVSMATVERTVQNLVDQQDAAGGPNLNNPHSQKLLALFGSHDRHLLTDLAGTAKIHHFQHVKLALISDQLTKVLAQERAARENLDRTIDLINNFVLDEVTFEPDADGELGTDAKRLKALYRELKLYVGEIEHAIAHSGILIEQYDKDFKQYEKMIRIGRAHGQTRSAAFDVRYLSEQQIRVDSAKLQTLAVPLINTLEDKIAGIEPVNADDNSSQSSLSVDLARANRGGEAIVEADADSGLQSGDDSDEYVESAPHYAVPRAQSGQDDDEYVESEPHYAEPRARGTASEMSLDGIYDSISLKSVARAPIWESLYDSRPPAPLPPAYRNPPAFVKVTVQADVEPTQEERDAAQEQDRIKKRDRAAAAALLRSQVEVAPEPEIVVEEDGGIALAPLEDSDDEDGEVEVRSKPPILPSLPVSRTLSQVSLVSLDTATAILEGNRNNDGSQIHDLLK